MAKRKKEISLAHQKRLTDFWTDRIRAAKELKQDYMDRAEEVAAYFQAKHDNLYEETKGFLSFTNMIPVSVPKIAQMKNSIGPRLYVVKPTRTVYARGSDTVMLAMARVIGAYLTYTAREAKYARMVRKTIDDGLLRGRCFLRQIWDDIRKIVASEYVDSRDVVFDPDFECLEDAQWVAIRHREPLWQLRRRLPEKVLKDLDCHHPGVIGKDEHNESDTDDEDEEIRTKKPTVVMVEWWEILSKMGKGYRGADMPEDFDFDSKDGDDFCRLEVILGHRRILDAGEWDVPLYLDREWPLSFVDFVETPGRSWPESPCGQVIVLQKVIDLLTSIKLSGIKHRDRVLMLTDKKISAAVHDTLRCGSAADLVPVELPPGYTLDMIAKVLDFGPGSPETPIEREFILKEMEVTLGTTSQVTGGQDAQAADRSATASQLRNSGVEVRTADYENKRDELLTDASRKEAIMVRLFLKESDVAPYIHPGDIKLFYVAIEVPGEAIMAVRPPNFGKETEPDPNAPLTLLDVYPGAATYFTSPEEALSAMESIWLTLESTMDPRLVDLRNTLLATGQGPLGVPAGMTIAPVTVERVWRDTSGLTPEELMRELSYEIEAGKGVKFNKQAEQQSIDMQLQTLLPVVLQLGDFRAANQLLALRDDAYDVPPEKQVRITPPMPGEEPQGKDKGEGKKGKGGDE